MKTREFVRGYLMELVERVGEFDMEKFEKIATLVGLAAAQGKQIFVFGNGGSAATASHLAADLNFVAGRKLKKKFKVLCLNDNIPTMLAIANDTEYNNVFSTQLQNFLRPGDLVIGISGSGNSENVLRALRLAKAEEATTIGITGFDGGVLARIVDFSFIALGDSMQIVEDQHLIFCHMLMLFLFSVDAGFAHFTKEKK